MGRDIQRESDVDVDLESGENTSEEDTSNDERESKSGFRWALDGVLNLDGSDKGKYGIESCSSSSISGGGGGGDIVGVVVDEDNLELLVDNKDLDHVQQQFPYINGNHSKQKSNPIMMPSNPRKPSKPPLPPKGPSLDAGDQKFVKELAELALRKRARIKKMKAVRKMKASKSLASTSSSSSTYTSLSAMVITLIFFFVIILHGIRSASSTAVGLMVSPESTVAADEGLISVKYPTNFTGEGNTPGSGSHYPSLPEV